MFLAKLKSVAAVGALAALAVAPLPAAPVPAKAGDDLIWIQDRDTGAITAITPAGVVKRAGGAENVRTFMGIDPSRDRVYFVGRGGKRLDPVPDDGAAARAGGTTVHARPLGGGAVVDLGIPCDRSGPACDPYGRTFRSRLKEAPAAPHGWAFEHVVIDLATKRETAVVAGAFELKAIAPDGSWALAQEHALDQKPSSRGYRYVRLPLDGRGPPRLLSERVRLDQVVVSPDGRRVLAFGEDMTDRQTSGHIESVYVIDVAAGTRARVAGDPRQAYSVGVWSPDGRRFVYSVWTWGDGPIEKQLVPPPPTRFVVCDADGKNAKTISTVESHAVPFAWW